jgi:hypothetical protein
MQTHYEQQYVSKDGVTVVVPAYRKVSMTKRDHDYTHRRSSHPRLTFEIRHQKCWRRAHLIESRDKEHTRVNRDRGL